MKKKEINHFLNLSYELAKSSVKLRNEGTILGFFWYILEPLLLMSIFLVIRSSINVSPFQEYPIYLFIGLTMFNYFSKITSNATTILKNNSNLLKSIKIMPESIVFSLVLESLFSHLIEVLIIGIFVIYFDLSIFWLLLYPIILVPYTIFISGIVFILSIIGVYISDLNNVWKIVTRILFFATPLFYITKEGTIIEIINRFNPLTIFINLTRDLIIYHHFPYLITTFGMFTFSILVFIIGFIFFKKNKMSIAERV